MAVTQSQRAVLYASLVDSMGEEAADTLMDQLPPTGWDQMATKDDLAAVESRLQAALATATAEINVKLTEGLANLQVAMHAGFAEAARERAEIVKSQAEIFKSQAKQLYVIVATIAAATISIWIALFTTTVAG